MKAAVYKNIENISIEDADDPVVKPGGVLLKVLGCSICGTDVRSYYAGSSMINPPWIIGHEIVAEVVEDLSDQNFEKGRRVTVATAIPCGSCRWCQLGHLTMCPNIKAHGFHYPGGFAEYMFVDPVAIRQQAVNYVPDHVDTHHACLTEPLACVLNAHEFLNISPADDVVVIGTGAIGCMHLQVSRMRGANRTIAVDVNPERLKIAENFDVDFSTDGQNEFIEEVTDGKGADVVIVACGVAAAQAQSLEIAAPKGRICFFGGLPKTNPISELNSNHLHYKELTIGGSFSSSPRQNTDALKFISSGQVRVGELISERLPLQGLVSGIEQMKRGEAMKIVIQP